MFKQRRVLTTYIDGLCERVVSELVAAAAGCQVAVEPIRKSFRSTIGRPARWKKWTTSGLTWATSDRRPMSIQFSSVQFSCFEF